MTPRLRPLDEHPDPIMASTCHAAIWYLDIALDNLAACRQQLIHTVTATHHGQRVTHLSDAGQHITALTSNVADVHREINHLRASHRP